MYRGTMAARLAIGLLTAVFSLRGTTRDCIAQATTGAAAEVATVDNAVSAAFRVRDTDGDGFLTDQEFAAGGGQELPVLRRDFLVFDADRDGRLSVTEFLTVPAFTPEDQRSAIRDPVVLLSKAGLSDLEKHWDEWDQDGDGSLVAVEFKAAAIGRRIRGLEMTGFDDWDLDHDGKVSREEAALLLDIAFGVRVPTGELLRSKAGRVLDMRMFRGMNPDGSGKVAREDYIKAMGSVEAAEKWFPTINAVGNERFGVTEFSTSGHRTDPVGTFLSLDVDLNGRLDPKELGALPAGWGPPGKNWLAGFDDDGDGSYSLREFQLMPHVNLLATWHSAQDANQDGKLSPDEFRLIPGPALAALSAEYFKRLDLNKDQSLSLKEWTFLTTHPEAKFLLLDGDSDGELTEAEFITEGSLPADRLRRDFIVFDSDSNGRMTRTEFLTIPHWVPEDLRTPIPDPVVLLSKASLSDLEKHWGEWDQDSDGSLAAGEFKTAAIGQRIRGLETTRFDDWDLDHDGKVTREEAARLLDIAFGVCVATGERMRSKSGAVADWRGFRGLDPDGNGRVTREEYLRMMSGVPKPEDWYRSISKDDAESFGVTEFLASPYHTDPVGMFLNMDQDLNGRLTREELAGVPADWGPPAKIWLAGFDDDNDGGYSLREFMLIPHVNLLAAWHGAQDANQDGKLGLEEFRFVPVPAIAALSAEYFRRLDVNRDQSLSLSEWPFQTSHPDAKFLILDGDSDGELTEAEFTAEGSLPAERLRRDFMVFDADGNGRLTRAEFLTIPYWVAEKHQTTILDPVVLLSQASLSSLMEHWKEWDQDGDGSLSESEFKSGSPGRSIRGLETVGFADWDLDHDGKVSRENAALLLDVAFGVRVATGELLRSNSGNLVDWGLFRALDPDGDGRVPRDVYLRHMSAVPNADDWYRSVARDGGDSFGAAEFVISNHRTGPVSHFLALDADLNGRLSPEELKPIPWGPAEKRWLVGFDDDGDGGYSLREFLRIPYINILAAWHAAQDTNQDGKLSLEEFRFAPAPALAAISAEYFRRLDVNHDESLSLSEWPFQTSSPEAKFAVLDGDSDGELTEAEFTAEGSLPADRLRRDFRVFDGDGNGRMTLTEFLTIPHWVPEVRRTAIPDPVVLLSAASLSELTTHWDERDKNGDGFLDAGEFKSAAIGRGIRGLEMTGFSDWDLNRDAKVSREEAALLLDIAFGVRSPTGEMLRSKAGHVVDWRGFLAMNPDKNGKVQRDAYIKSMGPSIKPEAWFPTIYAAGNEAFGVKEFLTSNHKTDPISQFLGMDADLNGLLSPKEMEAIPQGWGPPGRNWLAGFDDDGDGSYSLQEFRLIPHVNLLATWHSAQDKNNDGKLSPEEFRFMPAPALAALTAEYFRRLDTDKDGFLGVKEWSFAFDLARVPRDVILLERDQDGDGRLTLVEIQRDLRPSASAGPADQARETMLARMEEAFRRADANQDGALDRAELATDDGIEAVAPGAVVRAKSVVIPPAVSIGNAIGMDEVSVRTYAIIEFNILLVVAVGIYLYRRRGQKNE